MLSVLFYTFPIRNCKHFFRKRNFASLFIFILFLFFSYETAASPNLDNRNSLHLFTKNKDFGFNQIKPYLINAQNLVSYTLNLSFSSNCRIYLKDSYKKGIKVIKGKNGTLKIYLNSNYSLITKNRTVSRTLLSAFVLSTLNLSYSKDNINKITWFVDALMRKWNKQTFPPIYPNNASFPGIHALLLCDYKFQPDIIINNSVSSNKGVVYQINSEAAEILLDSILSIKNGRKILVEYFKRVCTGSGKNKMDVFYSVLSKNLQLSKKKCKSFFIKHLNDIAFKSSINLFMPVSVKYATNAFQTACTVSYTLKNSLNIRKECPLEDLPIVWNSIAFPDKLTRKLETQFVHFKSFFPFLLQKPINGMIKSLRKFREQKNAKMFKKNVLLYKKEFREAVIKEIKLRKLLRDKEVKHVRVPARYDSYFQVIDTDNKNLNELWPELNNYLTNIL
jgi:hypothetical protein